MIDGFGDPTSRDVLELVFGDEENGWSPDEFTAWLVRDGVTVCYLSGEQPGDDSYFDFYYVAEVETREGYRNMGVAKKLIALVQEYFDTDNLTCSGELTPDGFNYLRKKFSTNICFEYYDEPSEKPMPFVGDWDKKLMIHELND